MAKLTHIVTGKARLSYVNILAPKSFNGSEAKYSVTVLVPKSDVQTKANIDAAIEAAKEEGKGKCWQGQIPAKVYTNVYDGDGVKPSDDMPFPPECKGHWVFTASNKRKPGVVDENCQPIMDSVDVYSGMYGRVAIDFFPYAFSGKKGVSCSLANVQKLADGEPLGGGTTVEEDFGRPAQQINPLTGMPM